VLHRGTLAAEHGKAEHAAHYAQGTEHTGEGKLFDRKILHDKLAPFQPSAAAQDECRRSRNKTARARNKAGTGTEGAVEAYWLPLTPEHGFPSLHSSKAQGAPPQPVTTKKETPSAASPVKIHKQCYDFLRRHYPHQVQKLSENNF